MNRHNTTFSPLHVCFLFTVFYAFDELINFSLPNSDFENSFRAIVPMDLNVEFELDKRVGLSNEGKSGRDCEEKDANKIVTEEEKSKKVDAWLNARMLIMFQSFYENMKQYSNLPPRKVNEKQYRRINLRRLRALKRGSLRIGIETKKLNNLGRHLIAVSRSRDPTSGRFLLGPTPILSVIDVPINVTREEVTSKIHRGRPRKIARRTNTLAFPSIDINFPIPDFQPIELDETNSVCSESEAGISEYRNFNPFNDQLFNEMLSGAIPIFDTSYYVEHYILNNENEPATMTPKNCSLHNFKYFDCPFCEKKQI